MRTILSRLRLGFVFVFVLAVFVGCSRVGRAAPEAGGAVRMNTVGFVPQAHKHATVATARGGGFVVERIQDGAIVFEGVLRGPIQNVDTDESLFVADFSEVREPGRYRVVVAGLAPGDAFDVAPDVWVKPFRLVTRGMYLWRCGVALHAEHDGSVFTQHACHLEDGWMDHATGVHERRDATGGWHDAGDYNKYVTNAGVTVGAMLRAWEDFGPRLARVDLGIPESGGPIPDLLAEIKWKVDWLLKMQEADGRVYHKISTTGFGGFIPPHEEKTPRYFVPWGTTATADFVAMLAGFARVVAPYDAAYAERCLQAARSSWAFLQAHPDYHKADQSAFSTGPYESNDSDDRLWAAAEYWAATGDPAALSEVEARIRAIDGKVETTFDWAAVANLGVLTWLFSEREGRDPELLALVRRNLVATADDIVATAAAHGYARPLGTFYNWGCNGSVARQAVMLHAAYRLSPKSGYIAAARDAVGHLLGRNIHGRSYVTGLGARPPMHPHDRRSGGDDVVAPWPGYLVGGPNPRAIDWFDEQPSYRTNEIAINWNGALIYALAMDLPE
ncbi:glycoside hydrolase family 9 protein [Opitutales bacterium ASA1]|nr:glycoside hydrolase family 9 protein [Opitutales bacterium ASA1]